MWPSALPSALPPWQATGGCCAAGWLSGGYGCVSSCSLMLLFLVLDEWRARLLATEHGQVAVGDFPGGGEIPRGEGVGVAANCIAIRPSTRFLPPRGGRLGTAIRTVRFIESFICESARCCRGIVVDYGTESASCNTVDVGIRLPILA